MQEPSLLSEAPTTLSPNRFRPWIHHPHLAAPCGPLRAVRFGFRFRWFGGMSVLSSKALHEQLSVIMAALTKAAVAEICGVVDEGYAVLQLEISRSHKENEDLKKKLHLIESIVVRGSSGGGGGDAAEGPEVSPAAEAPQKPGIPQQPREGDGGAAREELPEVVLIKDEDSDSNDIFEESTKLPADGGAASAREAIASTPMTRRAKRRWLESVEAEERSSSEQIEHKTCDVTEGTQETVSVYSLDSPEGGPGVSGQLEDEVEMEPDESVGAYSSQMDPDVHVVEECSLVSSSANRPVYFSGGALIESPSNSAELGLAVDQTWPKQSKAQMTFAPFHQNGNTDSGAFGLKLLSVSGSTSTDCQLSEASNSAFEYEDAGGDVVNFTLYRDQQGRPQLCDGQPSVGGRGKRFVCSLCNKTYATSQNLEVHMRIHTGERPFSCEQCGKKFTQSAHLKSHLSVHTGERPYACTLCSRSFIVKYSLKLHMKKCHPNVQSDP